MEKFIQHENKYVRKNCVDLAVNLLSNKFQDDLYLKIINDGLEDESIEVRKSSLEFFNNL